MLKQLLICLAQNLVDKPDEVEVTEHEESSGVITFELKVAESDMGKIIGKQGRIAKALRVVMKAAASKAGSQVNVEILS